MRRPISLAISIFLVSLYLISCSGPTQQFTPTPSITSDELMGHISYLASEELAGRKPGTPGGDAAAHYIARHFESFGVLPAGDDGSYLQALSYVADRTIGKKNSLTLIPGGAAKNVVLKLHADFRPVSFSASSVYRGGVVFAGYGITAKDGSYDDYSKVDVRNKGVMILRGSPDSSNPSGNFRQYQSLRVKALRAKEAGASAIFFVTGEADHPDDVLPRFTFDRTPGDIGVPVVSITRATANKFLAVTNLTIRELQEIINTGGKPNSFAIPTSSISLETELADKNVTTYNVVGIIPGNDPVLRKERIVIGAHYDHLGMGGEGSGSTKPDTVATHNGADDNASGTAGLLEIAQAFAARQSELKRSIVVIAFAAEEVGLIGSSYHVNQPTFDASSVIAMINMDMIGRLTENKLSVFGTGTSPLFEPLLNEKNSFVPPLALSFNKDGFGPSDQSSFYAKDIPVLHFFTGTHTDYHSPFDDIHLINGSGTQKVTQYVYSIASALESAETRPQFAKVETARPQRAMGGTRVYTGVVPDFAGDAGGLKLAGVRDGAPSQKAGLQKDDIITKFGTVEIKNIEDYMYALTKYKPGDEVEVVYKRGNEEKTVKMTLTARN